MTEPPATVNQHSSLPDPDPRIQAELAQEVQFVLALMPVSYRTILVLRDLEGFSSSEVAAIVGRREATVRWRLSKAREKISRNLGTPPRRWAEGDQGWQKLSMPKSIGTRECGWVRARLPLWVHHAVRDEQSQVGSEGSDLSAKDSSVIALHLAACTSCHQHRLNLERALGALAVAAADLPLAQDPPSLWPELERRIANPQTSDGRRDRHVTDGAARSPRPWSDLDGDRPISRAWTRDTIGELLTGRRFVRTKSRRKTDLILKLSVAATILIGLVLFQILQRKYNDAEAMIAANRVPLDELVVPMSTSDEPVVEITDHSANEVPPNQLADADPQRPDEFQAPAVETAPILKSSPPTRFGFDLDHGTPMPPDSRDAKPVY